MLAVGQLASEFREGCDRKVTTVYIMPMELGGSEISDAQNDLHGTRNKIPGMLYELFSFVYPLWLFIQVPEPVFV